MKIEVYKVNAFIGGENGGNPAGVVLSADTLTADQMQRVAKIANFSETAFILKSKQADYKVRFFAPTTEVPLCGHATIATFHLLSSMGKIIKDKATQETSVGVLDLKMNDGVVLMEQSMPAFSSNISKDEVLKCLNINDSQLIDGLPIEIVSTGFPTILVPIKKLVDLINIEINLERSRLLSKQTLLFHPFTFESINEKSIAFSRNFFPDVTEDEDAATGTSTGALACYLHKYGFLDKKINDELSFDQGNFMNKSSKLIVKLDVVVNILTKVWVGGKCRLVEKFNVEL